MPSMNKSLIQFGRKFASTDSIDPSWLGKPVDVAYVGPNASGGLVRDADALHITSRAVLMRNESGGNIYPGQMIVNNITADNWMQGILDAAAVGEIPFGVVDPFLTAAIADDEYCLVIIRGPCKFLQPEASASVVAGDFITNDAEGCVSTLGATIATTELQPVGQVFGTGTYDTESVFATPVFTLVDGVFFGNYLF